MKNDIKISVGLLVLGLITFPVTGQFALRGIELGLEGLITLVNVGFGVLFQYAIGAYVLAMFALWVAFVLGKYLSRSSVPKKGKKDGLKYSATGKGVVASTTK